MTRQQVLQTAVSTYGKGAQMQMAIEEMSELTKALCKHFRSDDSRTVENIVEEMADVKIMLAQLEIIFGSPAAVEEKKLERLAGRLGIDYAREEDGSRMKEWVKFYSPDGKELLRYTVKGTFPGEMQSTKEQLAYENGLKPEDIITKIE